MSRKRYKCCVVGDHGVGKTSIIYSLLGKPTDNLQSTIGIDFFSTTLLVNTKDVYMNIWDTAGAERFHSLMDSYARDSDIIIVVYDLTNKNAMQRVTYWLRQIEHIKPSVVVVLGNKNDLSQVTQHCVHDVLDPYTRQNWCVVSTRCSSRKRSSVQKVFRKAITMLVDDTENNHTVNKIVRFTSKRNHQTQKCCT